MTRDLAIANAAATLSTTFREDLARRVARKTESQNPNRTDDLRAYITDEIIPAVSALGFTTRLIDATGPFLIATRHEAEDLPTVLLYGHGDVVLGDEPGWRAGLDPWTLTVDGDRWYGRGTADNKGQHSIILTALAQVLATRGGRLGFNTKLLLEMGEEIVSPGLHALARAEATALAADLLIASDGPRLSADRPTVFLGSRGSVNFNLTVDLRAGGHHSGNWGGLLANPGTILANAIATLIGPRGRILIDALKPAGIPDPVRAALRDIQVGGGPGDPAIDPDWGEPGLTPAEKVFAWNTLEVLAFETGNPRAPLNAVPPSARATLQLRFVVGTEGAGVIGAVRRHLDAHGFQAVTVTEARQGRFAAARLDPEDPWVAWVLASIAATTGKTPALLPNFGGSLPNDVFADILNLPTLWVPHSYPACNQHAPDEHLLAPVAEEGLRIMAGLFWDLGATGPALVKARRP
jgi:acetylornithine deacetylase/succinyl-diaminopimelate desuccinylase-like protein